MSDFTQEFGDDDAMTGPPLQISFDHIWPGSEVARIDHEHPDRADRCSGALDQVFAEIADGRGKCTECDAAIVDRDGLGECSVAHMWNMLKAPSIAIPFCWRCAFSPEAVWRLAQTAVTELTGKPIFRRP